MWKRVFAVFAVATMSLLPAHNSWGGGNLFRQNAVGGVSINPAGQLREPDAIAIENHTRLMKDAVKDASAGLVAPVGMRMVSLRGLEAAISNAMKDGQADLPEDIKYLAGIQRVQYVFVYPETNDIVLAGPGEGWRVDDQGNVVGITTGRPVIHIDDLLIAFRTARNANEGQGISCSIDPTQEGRQNFKRYMSGLRNFRNFSKPKAEAAMGPQRITLSGVPADSHFARVMVASDFRMKRYAMRLEKAPIDGLPSFLDLMRAKRAKVTNDMPRWWLACNYDGISRSEDGLAWQLKGPGVKVMTEDDFIAADGKVKAVGKANPIAQQWADNFTAKYDELTRKDIVFGELRNIMDLCVVAALIEKYGLMKKAGLELPMITSAKDGLATLHWNAPKTVSTSCSFLKIGRNFVITTSGGVQIESWEVASHAKMSPDMPQLHRKATASGAVGANSFWWN